MKHSMMPTVVFEEWALDEARRLRGPSGLIRLSRTECKVFETLFAHRDKPVSLERILDGLWGDGEDGPEMKTINVYICRLRKKFHRAGVVATWIETLREGGYVLRVPEAPIMARSFTPSEWRAVNEAVAIAESRVPGIRARTGL
jgi:DNA-binding response OmpR family regulator